MTRRATIVLVLFLTGCGFFGRTQNRFFSIDRVPPAAPIPAAAGGAPIGIESLELPPGFEGREIVVRRANQQVDVRSNHLWSGPYEPLVLHTLAFNLAARLPEGMVILPGAARPLSPVRSVDVVFEELAAGPENRLVLDARWTVGVAGTPATAHRERITVDLQSLDSAQIATATSQALGMLADRMAAQLAR